MQKNIIQVIDLVPGQSLPLESLNGDALDAETFWSEYVCQHKPVLIKGGAKHWTAVEKWAIPGYLEERAGDLQTRISDTFNPVPSEFYAAAILQPLGLKDCLHKMRNATPDHTYSIPSQGIPRSWNEDLGQYFFLDRKNDLRPRIYPRRRLFIYKNASTEWHYHFADETLTTQIVGAKKVSLFKLDSNNWDRYALPIEANFHHMQNGAAFFPNDVPLQKYEGLLEAGDVLYLPPFWWHGIDTANAEFGVTLAHCFKTPLRLLADWKEPAIRAEIRKSVTGNKWLFLWLITRLALSKISRFFHARKQGGGNAKTTLN